MMQINSITVKKLYIPIIIMTVAIYEAIYGSYQDDGYL